MSSAPMYHAILLERILDLLNAWPEGADPFPGLRDRLRSTAEKALDWLDVMTVGGRFALFNDAAYDTALPRPPGCWSTGIGCWAAFPPPRRR
jgi:hypothetical protein